LEKTLVSIWTELLGIDRLGILDNFFELGGHSLLATRVWARVQARLMIKVPLRVMFDGATVAELARAVEQAGHEGAMPEPPVIRPLPRKFAR
jgi:hypothetical protein